MFDFWIDEIIKEIEQKRGHIKTENVIFSIGEIISMYKDKDLNIHPDFQRFFRWNNEQKSRLIESIFLGLPIPSFFVYEDNENVWEVLDGLQRISSILEYIGELKNSDNKKTNYLVLEGLQYLKNMEGTRWTDLTDKMQRGFKKSTLPFIVMKNETTEIKKYQLFQRLNRGGSTLTDAEVRNCIILMEKNGKALMNAIDLMVKNKNFQNVICMNERRKNEKYDFDLVIRYLCFKYSSLEELLSVTNVGDFLDAKIVELASNKLDYDNEILQFEKMFFEIDKQLGDIAFKRYKQDEDRFVGSFLMAQYESIVYGLLTNNNYDNLLLKLKKLSIDNIYLKYSVGGNSVKNRWNNLLILAKNIFKNE